MSLISWSRQRKSTKRALKVNSPSSTLRLMRRANSGNRMLRCTKGTKGRYISPSFRLSKSSKTLAFWLFIRLLLWISSNSKKPWINFAVKMRQPRWINVRVLLFSPPLLRGLVPRTRWLRSLLWKTKRLTLCHTMMTTTASFKGILISIQSSATDQLLIYKLW